MGRFLTNIGGVTLVLSHDGYHFFAHCYRLLFSVYREGCCFPAVLFCIITLWLLSVRYEFLLSLAMLLSKRNWLQIRGREIMTLNQKVRQDQENLSTSFWRAEHKGQVLSAAGEGDTVASLSLFGISF